MIEGVLMLSGVLIFLLIIFIFNNNKEKQRKWKIRKGDANTIAYWEMDQDRTWRKISFECDFYAAGVPRHALYIPKEWNIYPAWAQARRNEILKRINSVLKAPEYTIIESD